MNIWCPEDITLGVKASSSWRVMEESWEKVTSEKRGPVSAARASSWSFWLYFTSPHPSLHSPSTRGSGHLSLPSLPQNRVKLSSFPALPSRLPCWPRWRLTCHRKEMTDRLLYMSGGVEAGVKEGRKGGSPLSLPYSHQICTPYNCPRDPRVATVPGEMSQREALSPLGYIRDSPPCRGQWAPMG